MICNAGVTDVKTCVRLRDMPMDDFMRTFNLNYFCPVVMTKEALPHLEKTKGSIVHVSSSIGKVAKRQDVSMPRMGKKFTFVFVVKLI